MTADDTRGTRYRLGLNGEGDHAVSFAEFAKAQGYEGTALCGATVVVTGELWRPGIGGMCGECLRRAAMRSDEAAADELEAGGTYTARDGTERA